MQMCPTNYKHGSHIIHKQKQIRIKIRNKKKKEGGGEGGGGNVLKLMKL